jgi:intein-encoded DNA endonuclease-like protein
MTLKAFIAATPANGCKRGRRCLLTPHRADVLQLSELGYTHLQIIAYLRDEKGLSVSLPTVSRYIKTNKPCTEIGESNV